VSSEDLQARALELKVLAFQAAIDSPTPIQDSYAADIKNLVQQRLEDSNRGAKVERTPYFNHSSIPDFVVSWGKPGYPRDIFLRGSYAAIVAAREAGRRREGDPVFMSLDNRKEFSLAGHDYDRISIAQTVSAGDGMLITDLKAFSTATAEPEPSGDFFPLQELVRVNFVRGGRGLFDDEQVNLLVDEEAALQGTSLIDQVAASFTEETQDKFRRAAVLIDLSQDIPSDDFLDQLHLLRGRLTREEVRSLLPWILRNAQVGPRAELWRRLGELLDLELLESESDALQDLDFTPLIEANVSRLLATRAYAGLNPDPDAEQAPISWRMQGSTLTKLDGPRAIRFALLGTRLKSTGSFSTPRWTDLRGRLEPYSVTGAGGHGIDEEIRVESRRGRNIRESLDYVAALAGEPGFFIDDVSLRVHDAGGDERTITVDFGSRLVVSSGEVELGSLLSATQLLDRPDSESSAPETD